MSDVPPSRGGIGDSTSPRPMTSGDNESFASPAERNLLRRMAVTSISRRHVTTAVMRPDSSQVLRVDSPLPEQENFNDQEAGDRSLSQGIELSGIAGPSRMERPGTRRTSSYGQKGEGSQRPTTSGRSITARPTSAALRGAPSTASRLISTAAMQRPGTRTGVATGIGVGMPINVVDRPITQQGLTGMKTGSRGPQRQFQDQSYFMGLLHTKISDLTSEIGRLGGEIDIMKKEQSTFLTYDKRVKEMAQELTELQGNLSDYNLLLDLINTDTEQLEIDAECKELKEANEVAATKLDTIFAQKQDLEKNMRQMEMEIEEERHMGESLVDAMQPQLRSRYMELRNMNSSLLQHLDRMQQELDILNQRKVALEDDLSLSKVKQESVGLYARLQELEEKKEEIISENQKRGSPQEERERLLLQVKEDNGEIAAMERQISEVQDELSRLSEEVQQADQELEENRSDRSQKFRELKKREETMETFLQNFDQNKGEELKRLNTLEDNNVAILEKISRNLSIVGHLPSTGDFDTMRSELSFKEGELAKSRYTEKGLKQEHMALQSNLQRIEALEGKIQNEMIELKEKVHKMENEMVEFGDIDGLKFRAEEKRKKLIQEKEQLENKQTSVKNSLREVTESVETLKKQLGENETYTQLKNLEKKWALLEQSNYSLKDFVSQRRAESNYVPLKNQAMKMVAEYNKVLQEVVQNGGIIG